MNQKNKKRIVVVLGMHRSGTSAITRGLELLGVDLGENLMPPVFNNNEKGFYEDVGINELNTELLYALNQDWHDLSPVSFAGLSQEKLSTFKLRAMDLIRAKMGEQPLGLKNPSFLKLLPFWHEVFNVLDVKPSYVIAFRHPKSVAESLNKRDGFDHVKGYFLWLEHVIPSISETVGYDRIVVDFDLLMADPVAQLQRMSKALSLPFDPESSVVKEYINEFLDETLRHSKFELKDLHVDQAVPADVIDAYVLFSRLAHDEVNINSSEVEKKIRHMVNRLAELTPAFEYISRTDKKIVERDGQIAGLNETVSNYEIELSRLYNEGQKAIQQRDEQIIVLNNNIEFKNTELLEMRTSRSWKITKPLRMIGKVLNQTKRAIALLAGYRLRHPGLKGFVRLFRLIVAVYRIDGRRGLFSAMRDRQGGSRIEQACRSSRPVCLTNTRVVKSEDLPDNVAVQLHVFYVDVLSEIRNYLLHIPIEFSLYVTTDSNEKVDDIKRVFKSIEHVGKLEIKVTRNQGRDIAPMLIAFGQQLQNHALVLHLHTKKSPHNNELRGWRTYLMNCLLGSQLTVESIFTEFGKHESLGIFYPEPYLPIKPFMRLGGNSNYMYDLLSRSGRPSSDFDKIEKADFPAGSMFWFRGEVIKPLVDMNLSFDDFAVEAGQDDGTFAHAIERMFVYYASLLGFSSKAFLPSIMFSSTLPGAVPLTRSAIESFQTDTSSMVIVFDHNLGGGTNFYSQDLINTIIGDGRSVFRVYYSQEYSQWIVQTVSQLDGMFYATRNVIHLFEILEKTSCKKIIVNSLYLMPSVNTVIELIISLSQKIGASLDYKVHDFYAICPSQHLLNSESRYCNIPSDYSVCQKCLNVNAESLWKSTDSPTITNWRKPFTQLIDASSKVSVFDISSVDLLGTVFDIPNDKLVVKPHKIEGEYSVLPMVVYDGLHIGVLGTLTPAKGAYEINSLARYMRNKGISIPITVVGRSVIDMEPQIELLGSYEKNELPSIILRSGINVIFISSIIPETFSYTISEAIAMGVPLVAFDTGAQGRRVSAYEKGIVVPLDSSPATVLDALRKVYEINYQKEL